MTQEEQDFVSINEGEDYQINDRTIDMDVGDTISLYKMRSLANSKEATITNRQPVDTFIDDLVHTSYRQGSNKKKPKSKQKQ